MRMVDIRSYGNSRNRMAAVNTPANESGACLLVQPPLTSLQLSFTAAADYLQHLIRHGRCYSGSCVESRGPPASQLQVEQSLPSLESLSLVDEAKFFAPTSSQSSTRKRSTVSLKILTEEGQEDLSEHLVYALSHGLVRAAQQVIEKAPTSLDLNSPLSCANCQGLTPLTIAALLPLTQCLELLLSKDVTVDVTDSHGRTALHWSVIGGRPSSVKSLLKYSSGATLNTLDKQGLTPLLYAVLTGSHDITAAILKAGGSPDLAQSTTRATPLSLAGLHGHPDIVKLLIKYRASAGAVDCQGCSPLHCAVWGGWVKAVKCLLSHTPTSVTGKDQAGRTPLHYSAARGSVEMCQLLLKRGAQLSEVDSAGRTALHWAIFSMQLSCVECLLAAASNVVIFCNQPDCHGATPIHYAAMTGKCDLLSALVNVGGRTDITDLNGYSPLLWACACGHLDIARQLLDLTNRDLLSLESTGVQDENGLSLHSEGGTSSGSPLHVASLVGALDICQLFIKHSTTATGSRDKEGQTALHCASQHGHVECVEALLEAGVAPDTATYIQQRTSLHVASEGGHLEVVSRLLEAGASPDCATHPNGERPIHLAAHSGHANIIQKLQDHGCAPDVRRANDGHTALLVAAEAGHLQCCRVLLERGADPHVRETTVESRTALDVALVNGHREVADYLISQGVPSGGGMFHRAALTIQAVWRLHRHRRRCRSRWQWSAVIIQRAVRRWRGRRTAGRVRAVRERARNSAAATIQRRWRQYMEGRRRYEATSARLRARLHQEQLAATLLLEELQSQAHSIQLPPPTIPCAPPRATPLSSTPGYLLHASAPTPPPLVSSASLLFPTRPRKPLVPRLPLRFKTPPHHHHQQQEVEQDGNEERATPSAGAPLASMNARSPINTEITRDPSSPATSSLINNRSSSQLNDKGVSKGTTDGGYNVGVAKSLPAIPSGRTNIVSGGTSGNVAPGTEYMPETTQQETTQQESSPPELPPITSTASPPSLISQPSQTQEETGVDTTAANTSKYSRETCDDDQQKRVKEESTAVVSLPTPCPAYMRQTLFRAADDQLGHHTRWQRKERDEFDGRLLGPIQRYDRLNHVLSLLQQAQARGSGEAEGGGEAGGGGEQVKLSELREQIRCALDEAVRLRTDTELLQQTTKVKLAPKPSNSLRT